MTDALEILICRVVNAQLTRKHDNPAAMPWINADTVRREVLSREDCPPEVRKCPGAIERLARAELKRRGLSSRDCYVAPAQAATEQPASRTGARSEASNRGSIPRTAPPDAAQRREP